MSTERRPPTLSTAEVRHPFFARFQAWVTPPAELLLAPYRQEMLAGVCGRVLEVGAGTGVMFAHYPSAVTEVVAVEPEPYLRRLAERAAAQAPVPVRVVAGLAERLPFPNASFDAAVTALVLCTVTDQTASLAEIRRVLRPAGELRFFEHVRSDAPGLARRQQALDRWLWPRLGGGCHCGRDTEAAIRAAGFEMLHCRHTRMQMGRLMAHVSPAIVGAARRS